jgi:natural product biosynthesis luciferase-like monooxygenase protein
MDFGIMFFSSVQPPASGGRYDLLLDTARFADEHGFCAIWVPERHFHPFGGLFPNPAVVGAALATVTRRLQIRAGSLVSPLHDSLRIAEEWSVVDNLSGGRAAISFGSGWNLEDFLFFPERYERRQEVMYEQIEQVRRLWRGESLRRRDSNGREIDVRIFPEPVQADLPVWVTSSGNERTFVSAGEAGGNVLTHLIGQGLDELAGKIQRYRDARESRGFDPRTGKVTLMLHTFLGTDLAEVRRTVRGPFREYLRSALSLEQLAFQAGGAISGGHRVRPHEILERDLEDLLDLTFDRYFQMASLMGTPESCQPLLERLEEIGVDEAACLIDFLDDPAAILRSLPVLAELRAAFSSPDLARATATQVDQFLMDLEA